MNIDRVMLRKRLLRMKATLDGGGVQVVSSPSLFPTPPGVAAELVELADIQPGDRILEPSAGTGAIVNAIRSAVTSISIETVEINAALAQSLGARCADFLELSPEYLGKFDRIIMNPPFCGGADIKHILHALRFLKADGRLVAICAGGPRQQKAFASNIVRDLPSGTFQGTNVRSSIVLIDGCETK